MVEIDEFGTAGHNCRSSSLGRALPFTEGWTGVHEILARQAERFIELIPEEEKQEFLQQIDAFLGVLAQEHGYERRQIGHVARWFTAEGKGNQWLSDVHLLTTCFSEEKWDDLMALLGKIRPSFATGRILSESCANSSFGLVVVLKLLSVRAARTHDSEALEKSESIVADLSGQLYSLACRGAHHFESSRKRRNPPERAMGSDGELRDCAVRLQAVGVTPTHLTHEIVEKFSDRFGVEDVVRRRLQRIGIIPKREKRKKPT